MKLLSLLSAALGLSTGVQRAPSRSAIPEATVTISSTPDLDAVMGAVPPPSRRLWVSTFNRAEHRQGKRFRSQKERSNRRKASR